MSGRPRGRPRRGDEIDRADVLEMVTTYYRTFGVPPSVREVAAQFGLASTSAAVHHLRKLVHDGHLKQVRRMYLPVGAAA